METNKIAQQVNCPRCGNEFVCNPGNIDSCNCSKIELTTEEYRFISSKYTVCVCNLCLKALKEEYNSKFHYNKPRNFVNRTFSVVLFFSFILAGNLFAQSYAPPVGQPGTNAMHKDSSAFINWAVASTIARGYQDISNHSLGYATVGDNTMALGKALANGVVSLGDGGSAICTFQNPLKNGAGPDFAVFENSIDDTFLELAFVEVSSDGINYFRFPAHSLTDAITQTGGFDPTDATKINNLAGKYRAGYGTPFDLQELVGTQGLDLNNITHIKIQDVVGSINNAYASFDSFSNKINDPWPTPFPSGGFDLDAIGVIHENTVVGTKEISLKVVPQLYPNPVQQGATVNLNPISDFEYLELCDVNGSVLLKSCTNEISAPQVTKGIYFVRIYLKTGVFVQKLIVR